MLWLKLGGHWILELLVFNKKRRKLFHHCRLIRPTLPDLALYIRYLLIHCNLHNIIIFVNAESF